MKPTRCSFTTAWLSWWSQRGAPSLWRGWARVGRRRHAARMTGRGQGARATSGRWWRARADGDGLRASETGAGSRGRGPGRARVTARERTGGRARAARTAGSRAAALPAGMWRAEGGGIQGGGVASGFFQPKRAELGSKTFWAGARARARKIFCLRAKSK